PCPAAFTKPQSSGSVRLPAPRLGPRSKSKYASRTVANGLVFDRSAGLNNALKELLEFAITCYDNGPNQKHTIFQRNYSGVCSRRTVPPRIACQGKERSRLT